VEDVVKYALTLGFSPNQDYKMAARVFGGIDPKESTRKFEFGHQGKPFFIAGPNDSPEKVARICSQLARKCGEDGFHYLMPGDT